ncbi:hypothetical protein Fcan01_04962 [Folsomia candida]|uniref:Uncharacterized protein n=1 Tax=Folsomia candida TaxID=158441 RepID=A0A226ESK2_FOLCA|nr:hypothetical protein Fcan01_04962 [Folsomia candida]
MKSFVAFVALLFVTLTVCGNVDYDRCGMRIGGCEGRVCWMTPGTPYLCEGDLYPSSAAASLSLRVTAVYLTTTITIIDTVLENSSIQPGFLYTVKFTIVPNDILAGEYLPVQAEIYHTVGTITEICVGFHVRVEQLKK